MNLNINISVLRSFINFFILLIFLNPFLLIDPELLIFFSISLIILLFINNISEVITKLLQIKLVQYYYYYIRFYNLQLVFIFELSKYINLNLYLFSVPFFLKWFQIYFKNINSLVSLNVKNWNLLLNFNEFYVIKNFKINLYKFYINFFHLLSREFKVRFIKKRLSNYRALTNYILKHFKYKKILNKRRNAYLIRKDLPHLVKHLKLK